MGRKDSEVAQRRGIPDFFVQSRVDDAKDQQSLSTSTASDRPIGFLEMYAGNRSIDYPFGILQLDLKKNSKGREEGTGALIYAAKIKVLEGAKIEVESYGIEAIKLLGVRKL